jgi:hypothetical protein
VTNVQNPVRATGKCFCGSVKYSVHGPLRKDVVACHCTNCRRYSGGIFTGTVARKEHVSIDDDKDLKWHQTSPHARRGFCGNCGSTLFRDGPNEPLFVIAASSIDEPTGLKLAAHCWTSEAADFWSFDPGIPQKSEYSGLAGPEE